jgi:hypothetical protein
MCLVIVKPPGVTFSDKDLRDYEAHNPNGFGMMWHEDGKVNIMRTLNSKEIPLLLDMVKESEAVLHWRYTTAGTDSIQNTHPFEITPRLAMVHNGVLPLYPKDPRQSDTFMFANEIMPEYLNGSEVVDDSDIPRLDEWIGPSNRLVFLDDTGKITIVGKEKGLMHNGCWYSNTYAWTQPHKWRTSVGLTSYRHHYDRHRDPYDDDDYAWALPKTLPVPEPVEFAPNDDEIIVIDSISRADSKALAEFERDLDMNQASVDDFQSVSVLIDYYLGRSETYDTLAVLLWNTVRERRED